MNPRPSDCEPPVSPATEDELEFTRQDMEPWYNPEQLTRTGLRTIVSSLFGTYADRREMMACLGSAKPYVDLVDKEKLDEAWFDYVSDLGSGFNSTYSLAYLLGQEKLTLGKNQTPTQRGHILVMGGDEVYPTPSSEEYANRLVGPYRAARSYIAGDSTPKLFAIPGNHDWYDGLTSFLKVFCQERWIGGWKTVQSRSYFAIKLPHNWWIWGIDIQLSADIDQPQKEFFEKVNRKYTQPGDKVILCTAEPSWVYQAYKTGDKSFLNLEWFSEEYITRPTKAGLNALQLPLTITGDLHHYSSYFTEDAVVKDDTGKLRRTWKLTAGGGGAFLHPTHHLPETFWEDKNLTDKLPSKRDPKHYQSSAFFPEQAQSRRLALWNLLFVRWNFKFSLLMGCLSLLFSWMLASASGTIVGKPVPGGFTTKIYQFLSGGEALITADTIKPTWNTLNLVWQRYGAEFGGHPFLTLFILIIISGFVIFTDGSHKGLHRWHESWHKGHEWYDSILWGWPNLVFGVLHGIGQVFTMLTTIWIWTLLITHFIPEGLVGLRLLAWLLLIVIGGALSGTMMGLYLLLTNGLLGIHENEAFSALRIQDYKNFLRLHVTAAGLTIYPIKVERVPRRWDYQPKKGGGAPWYEPAKKDLLRADLIENPIFIPANPGAPVPTSKSTINPVPNPTPLHDSVI